MQMIVKSETATETVKTETATVKPGGDKQTKLKTK